MSPIVWALALRLPTHTGSVVASSPYPGWTLGTSVEYDTAPFGGWHLLLRGVVDAEVLRPGGTWIGWRGGLDGGLRVDGCTDLAPLVCAGVAMMIGPRGWLYTTNGWGTPRYWGVGTRTTLRVSFVTGGRVEPFLEADVGIDYGAGTHVVYVVDPDGGTRNWSLVSGGPTAAIATGVQF